VTRSVYTIGHSTYAIERFLDLLKRNEITAIADVRSQPYSRMNPQFNRETLRTTLKTVGISYVFLGKELGARSEDPSCYINGKVQYDRLAESPLFREGLDRVTQGSDAHRIALMCAEKDPLTCHRTILVSRKLVECGVAVSHILEGGRPESHDDALDRLLNELGIDDQDLFRTRQDVLMEAYSRRGEQIAYMENPKREATGANQ
jgi:uncharacterized protein (DUF488 family)